MSKVGGADRSAEPLEGPGPKIVQPGAAPVARLNSWKEIATYLGRDVRTVRRWEQSNGLPVHRLMHEKNATVYAVTSEVDEWLAKRSKGPQLVTKSEQLPVKPPDVTRYQTRRWMWGLLAAILTAGVAAGLWLSLFKGKSNPQARVPVPLTVDSGWEWGPQLSPDGRNILYTRGDENLGPQVVVQPIGGGQPAELAGAERTSYSPVWSSDGRFIAFLRQHPERSDGTSDLVVIPASGGPERIITKVAAPGAFLNFRPDPYLDWSPDDKYLAVSESLAGKWQHRITVLSLESGERRVLTEGVENIFGDYSPRFSPDGRRIAFTRVKAYGISDVFVLDVTPDLRPGDKPRRIASRELWNAGPAWTPDGRRLIFFSGTLRLPRLRIADAEGQAPPVDLPVNDVGAGSVDIAPAGRNELRLVYTRFREDQDIWKIPLRDPAKASEMVKLPSSAYSEANPRFSPDGRKFAFVSNRTGSDELWIANSDGSSPVQLTKLQAATIGRPAWSPDGQRIAFELLTKEAVGIYGIDIASRRVRQLAAGGSLEANPSWSPDGKWLYFSSLRSGTIRIWKVAAGGGEPIMAFDADGSSPLITPDGLGVVTMDGDYQVGLRPLGGGQAMKILDQVYSSEHIEVTTAGVYGVVRNSKDGRQILSMYSFADKKVRNLFTYPKPVTGGLSISRDGKYALTSMRDHLTIDVVMVDGLDPGSF